MGIRVAQVYTQFRSPVQPYLCATSERLGEEGIDLRIYTRMPTTGPNGEAVLLRGPAGMRGIPRALYAAAAGCGDLARSLREWQGLGWRCAFRRWLDLREFVRQEHDVIHLMNWPLYTLLWPYLERTGIPFVISFRGYDIYGAPQEVAGWAELLQKAFGGASSLHFVSEFLRQKGIEMGAPAKKSVVIYPSVGNGWLGVGKPERSKSGFRVFSTGRLVWEKGYELALLTLRELLRRGVPVEYHVAGDGPAGPGLRCWTQTLGLEDRVVWHGTLSPQELRAELLKSSVYFHPSVMEAFGVAILEAQALGLPVVVARAGGIPEAVVEGKTALVVEFGDVSAMADAIERLWMEPEVALQLGQSGRRVVEERFTVSREVAEWVDVYKRVAKSEGL